VDTGRLETFADGVFAIAATLLIIEVSADAHDKGLGRAVVHGWPQYAAYAVSFVTIGIMWLNHHQCVSLIDRADRTFMILNLGLLMCIAFVPYPTKLVAEHLRDTGERAAALTYGVTLTATACFFFAFWFYASHGRRLIAADADPKLVAGITYSYAPGALIYGTATLIAIWAPIVSIAMFAAITIFYVFESSVFGREPAVTGEQ
jgi:uncharacterized membrane protein